jgi:hypothetical protein
VSNKEPLPLPGGGVDENGVPAPATRGLSGRLRAAANRVISEKVTLNGGNGHGPDGEGAEAEHTAITAGTEDDGTVPPDES